LTSESVIEINHLCKKFKDFYAVNDLSLNVYKGDVFGFLGPNGAGKSTTIRMLLTLIFPTSGEIKLFGKELQHNRSEVLRKVGAIVEKPDLYGYLSAYKNLEILGKISGTNPTRKQIEEILDLVGLLHRAKSKVKTFSHGMKQRLGIAQALLHNPDLIVLDEPTTGLDPQGMKEIRDLIHMLSSEKKKTIFLSSHILYEIELVANRMVIINKGKTVVEGTVSDLLDATNLKVQIEVNDPPALKTLLSETSINHTLESVVSNNVILYMNKQDIPELSRMMINRGLEVSAIIPTRSLEEYFLQITEKGE